MHVAGFAALLLLTTFLLHVAIWRVRLPKAHTRALLVLFFGTLPLALAINTLLPAGWPLRLTGFWEHAHVCLFHIAMSLAYIEFYTAIEEESPSLTLLLFVEQAGDAGRDEGELLGLIDDQFIVGGRLRALVRAGVVAQSSGRYRLTASGRAWARFFQFTRWLYRLQLGG